MSSLSLLKRLILMKHESALSDVKVFNGKSTAAERKKGAVINDGY